MIERVTFWSHWERICRRFGREPDEQGASEFHAFLSARMSDEEFAEAARAVWASNRFFPRPADFLGVQAANEWRTVQAVTETWNPDTWAQLTTAAKLATEAVGGTPALKAAKDTVRMRQAWLNAYEQELQAEAAVDRTELPTNSTTPRLGSLKRLSTGDAA